MCTYHIGYINVLLRKVNIFKHHTLSDKDQGSGRLLTDFSPFDSS